MIYHPLNITDDNQQLRRIALCIQYDGNNFCGWQKQKQGLSIQEVLEQAISSLDPLKKIKAVAAGRTDAGVHASGQVVHFDCLGPIPGNKWSAALNGRLPKHIRVRESVDRPIDWHACYSAIYRRYRYTIYNSCKPNLFLSNWSWHKHQFKLDESIMKSALNNLIGLHDFSAFQRAGSNRPDAFTTIQDVKLERRGDLVFIDIQASGFLYGMVRLIVGQLVALGEHRLSLAAFEDRWKLCRRDEVKEAAPAKGLCFVRAGYKDKLFSKAASYDSQPHYSLEVEDAPNLPPSL